MPAAVLLEPQLHGKQTNHHEATTNYKQKRPTMEGRKKEEDFFLATQDNTKADMEKDNVKHVPGLYESRLRFNSKFGLVMVLGRGEENV